VSERFRFPAVETARCTSKKCQWQFCRWVAGRGGKFTVCDGCGERFPCSHACKHDDCREVRRQLRGVSGNAPEVSDQEHDKLAPEPTTEDAAPVEGTDDTAGSAEENAVVVQAQTQPEEEVVCEVVS